ncbi:MAG: tRNA 2-selenouridine(34) synthase MnmH [Bacteroidota bacterium]
MDKSIQADQIWKAMEERTLLDVRTPAEYTKGHIPGALSFPLFENQERVEIGTLYKQQSPRDAFLRGLELVGPKMADFVRKAEAIAPDKKLLLHCWRGGQRSGSMGWLLRSAGFDVRTLDGGYKAYRRFVHASFDQKNTSFIVLGGLTGCGKTDILHALRDVGHQVIDLEGIARHKGSAFGALGEQPQPTVEQFENDLYECCRNFEAGKPIWLENESKSIGRVYLPEGFWQNMKRAPVINIELPFERRLDILVDNYGAYPKEDLIEAFNRIRKRLGGQHLKAALEALQEGDLRSAAAIALRYYDKSYHFFLERSQVTELIPFKLDAHEPIQTAHRLIKFYEKRFSA